MKINKINDKEFKSLIRTYKLNENSVYSRFLIQNKEDDFYEVDMDHEQTIVTLGEVNQDISNFSKSLQYATVPFGLIISGGITIFLNGKAVRHLTQGDAFGIFETAHYLNFNNKKHLGPWTLLTEGETKIVFFKNYHIFIPNYCSNMPHE
jgi:hypothetical protein